MSGAPYPHRMAVVWVECRHGRHRKRGRRLLPGLLAHGVEREGRREAVDAEAGGGSAGLGRET